jgi:hypothetical protein
MPYLLLPAWKKLRGDGLLRTFSEGREDEERYISTHS